MKLIPYTNIRLSLFVFLLISIWGVFFFFAIHHEITDETDDMLRSYRDIFIKKALNDPTLLESSYETTFDRYSILPISEQEANNFEEHFYDEEVFFPEDDEHIPLRVFESIFRAADLQFYKLEIRMSTLERDDMIETLLIYLFSLFVLLLLIIIIGNTLILRRSFCPFRKLLDWLNSIVPGKAVPELNNDTKIAEFNRLNKAAFAMSIRNFEVYKQQKQFIENASHELQTPLAVVLNKLDMLSQNENITEEQLSEIDGIYKAINKAIRLNKSLLFLTRIENQQFIEKKDVNINQLVKETATDFIEIYSEKNIQFQMQEQEQLSSFVNEFLMQTLVTNLLKNAFIHTNNNGKITVIINQNKLCIENSGDVSLDQERIFDRFYHANDSVKNSSTGLGLAIAKSIASSNDFTLSYQFEGKHIFELSFVN